MHLYNNKNLIEKRRNLRKNGTPAEAALWNYLKRKQIAHTLFRRQFSIGPYIMDFYSPELRLCIELDGQVHASPEDIAKDEARSLYLSQEHGIKILQIENHCIFDNLDKVLDE